MQLLFIDYTKLIIKAYNEKRDAGLLSPLMMQLTTASIRQECIHVYNKRVEEKKVGEENTLDSFFGVLPMGRSFAQHIKKYPRDKFRPLQKLIKGEIKNPMLINVELFAWLIDFNPRPFNTAQKKLEITDAPVEPIEPIKTLEPIKPVIPSIPNSITATEPEQVDDTKEKKTSKDGIMCTGYSSPGKPGNISTTPDENNEGLSENNPMAKSKKNRFKVAALALIIPLLIWGAFVIINPFSLGCMYWNGDRYESVGCDEDPKGRIFLPLDKKMQRNFERITRKDTLTNWSVNRIYYASDKNKIEYFTGPGPHPKDLKRNVRKLTQRIFDNDSANRRLPANDSLVAEK